MGAMKPERRVALALGANLGDRRRTLDAAVALIGARIGPVVGRSSWIETAAVLHPDDPAEAHPSFLNGAVLVRTDLAPAALLDRVQDIERRLGRDRGTEAGRWQPRPIDIDVVAIEAEQLDLPGLVVPHPAMHERDFVLRPMLEIWPDWRHPRFGATVGDLLERV